MKNLLEPFDIKWKYVRHLTLSDSSQILCRDETYKIQWEQVVNRDSNGGSGKPKNYYFIDGQEKEYTDIEELCNDWNEMKNFDDPDNEIVWVKKIVKTHKLKG